MKNEHFNMALDKLYNEKDFVGETWTFFCNPKHWYIDEFLKSSKVNTNIYYSINKYHKDRFRVGDLGVLRVGKDYRNKSQLCGGKKMHSGIYAIVKVMSTPEFVKDNDIQFYANKDDANKEKWRVKIRVIKNLIDEPIIFNEGNGLELSNDKYLIQGIQRSTMPLEEDVFYKVLKLINTDNYDNLELYKEIIDIKRLGSTVVGIDLLNEIYSRVNIQQKEKVVKVIERGSIARKVKEYMQYKCQICESLGINAHSFKKKNGEYYVETHHIIPVSDTENSKLSVDNLICVCPNHHRQLHYGDVDIINNDDSYVEYSIDGVQVKIDKVKLNK